MIYIAKAIEKVQSGYYVICLARIDKLKIFIYNSWRISIEQMRPEDVEALKKIYIHINEADDILKQNLIKILLEDNRLVSKKLKEFLE